MNILVAPDKFKGSLSASEVSNIIAKGVQKILPESKITKIPLADGGEGSLETLEKTINFKRIYINVSDPIFRTISTYYGLSSTTAFIEMAKASGLHLLNKSEQNPKNTSSFGTGEMILHSIQNGAKKIYLFVGGSSTNDFGIGIASALGFKFYDDQQILLEPIGRNLNKIKRIDSNLTVSLNNIEFHVLADVNNQLYGRKGAAKIFAEQKGADREEISELDKGLINISNVVKDHFRIDVSKVAGGGAAGGVGAGAIAFCNAKISSGIEIILNMLNINEYIKHSDLVITGEGKLDNQTLDGKVISGVIKRCRKFNKPFGIVCGENSLSEDELTNYSLGIIKPIMVNGILKDDAIKNAESYIFKRAEELVNDYVKYFI